MNTKWTEERFVDTGEKWAQADIEIYNRWSQLGEDRRLLWNFTHVCQMINISWDDSDIIELNDRLEKKWNELSIIPPYITESWYWWSVYKSIQKVIDNNIGNREKLGEILWNVYWKWQIMLAREEFLRSFDEAIKDELRRFVKWSEWTDEEVQEYRESDDFASDYTFLLNLYLKIRRNLEFNKNTDEKVFLELSKELEKNFESLVNMPVHALDKSFRWGSLNWVCYKLSEKLPENERTVVDSLSFMFDQYWEFQDNNRRR